MISIIMYVLSFLLIFCIIWVSYKTSYYIGVNGLVFLTVCNFLISLIIVLSFLDIENQVFYKFIILVSWGIEVDWEAPDPIEHRSVVTMNLITLILGILIILYIAFN